MDLHSNDAVRKVNPITNIEATSNKSPPESTGSEAGVSSIEKSKKVAIESIPYSNIPLLNPPLTEKQEPSAIESIDSSGMIKVQFMKGIELQIGEIQQNVLEGWNASLREIEEEVRELLNSQAYLQKQELLHKIHTQSPAIEGISTGKTGQKEGLGIISALDNAHVIERLSSPEQVSESAATSESTQAFALSFAMSALIGGGLALGATSLSGAAATTPPSNLAGLVENLQALLPAQVSAADIIPMLNLMIAVPIYTHSWNNAVNNQVDRENKENLTLAQNFAKDVLKIVKDPTFNILGLVK